MVVYVYCSNLFDFVVWNCLLLEFRLYLVLVVGIFKLMGWVK